MLGSEAREESDRSLAELLLESVRRHGGSPCLTGLTYTDLLRETAALRQRWAALGAAPGAVVSIQSHAPRGTALDMLTALAWGYRPVLFQAYRQLRHVVAASRRLGARLLIRGECPSVLSPSPRAVSLAPEAALVASTSGSTGVPKLVQHSASAIVANVRGILSYVQLREGETVLVIREPTYLSVLTGELLPALLCGCRVCFAAPELTPHSLVRQAEVTRAAFVVGAPSFFRLALPVIRRRRGELVALRCLTVTGECAPLGLLQDLKDALPWADIINAYGLTETGPRLSYWRAGEHPCKPSCVGAPLPGVRVRVVTPDRRVRKPGERGLIEVATPSLMLGYVGCERPQGWFQTADYGWLDEKGLVFVQGRSDDMITRGAIKVSPAEVEDLMRGHPAVGSVYVSARMDRCGLARIEVAVSLRQGAQVTADDLKRWCVSRFPRQLWPDVLRLVPDLPAPSAAGKIQEVRRRTGP